MCTSRLTFNSMTPDVKRLAELNLPFCTVLGKLDNKTESEEQKKLFLFPSSLSASVARKLLLLAQFPHQSFQISDAPKHNCTTFLSPTSKYCTAAQNRLNSEPAPVTMSPSLGILVFPKSAVTQLPAVA